MPLALHPVQAVPCWVWLRKIMVHALTLCFLAGGVAPKGKAVSVPPFWEPTLEPALDPAWLLPSCDSLSLMICSFMASFPLNFSVSSAGSSSKRGTLVCPEGLTRSACSSDQLFWRVHSSVKAASLYSLPRGLQQGWPVQGHVGPSPGAHAIRKGGEPQERGASNWDFSGKVLGILWGIPGEFPFPRVPPKGQGWGNV